MGPYHWLIGSLIEESDDFCMRLRKSVSGVLFFPGSLVSLYYVIKMLIAPGTASGDGRWVIMASTLCNVIAYWAQYFYLRKTRTIGNLQAAFIIWVTTLTTQGTVWYGPDVDHKPIWVTMCLLAVLLQIPKVYVYLCFCFVLTIFGDWNTTHLEEPDQVLALPGAFRSQMVTRWIFGIQTSLLLGAVMYNFIQQVAESERRGAALKAANTMTLEILKYQRKYETEAIDGVLQDCKTAGVVEPELISLYEAMNVNLKSYRPFLPNYLFQETETEDEEAGGEAPGKDCDSEGALSLSRVSKDLGFSGRQDSTKSPSGSVDAGSSRLSISSRRHTSNKILAATHLNQRGSLFTGRITFALVDINTDRLAAISGGSPSQRSSADILKNITRLVYSLAKDTKASVHSMLGDTVQLTWSATKAVALPETKGAVFLARLAKLLNGGSSSLVTSGRKDDGECTDASVRSDSVLSTPLNLSAAVCSGTATVHNITTDNQQALVIEAPWLPALEGCFSLAKQVCAATVAMPSTIGTTGGTSCVLMDERTMKGSQLEVESCPVEQLRYTEDGRLSFMGIYGDGICQRPDHLGAGAGSPHAVTTFHQVLKEHIRADDEWMYQLQGGGTHEGGKEEKPGLSSAALMRKTMSCIAEGKFSDASATLAELRVGSPSQPNDVNIMFPKALEARCTNAN